MALIGLPGSASANLSGYGVNSPGNYVDVFGFDNADQASTALPHIYEREVTIYGNRTLMGFLNMVGAEMPSTSQQIRWAEQRRLHIFYNRVRRTAADANTFNIYANDGNVTAPGDALTNHAVRENDKVILSAGAMRTLLGIVTNVNATTGVITVNAYAAPSGDDEFDGLANTVADDAASFFSLLVVGTEFGKGSNSRDRYIQPDYDSYTNTTVIQRETYGVNGTDANQIGWVEIADENGIQGKYWYLKGRSEAMTKWMDYQETALLEDRTAAAGAGAATAGKGTGELSGGSEGFFQAIENRGTMTTGGFATSNTGFLNDLDNIVRTLDQEGNIEENVFFLDRDESLNFDNGMAAQNNGGQATNSSWGLFNNSENMGLSLGFTSVRRGSYDFYKRDWKYLNQVDGRRSFGGVKGVSVPMGTASVYDQYGANLNTPFASIYYLDGPMGPRKNQTKIHGGQAPSPTSGQDAMIIDFISEKCICLKGANNFILFGG